MKKIFEENFKNGEEENSQLCVYVGGTKVIDLYGTAIGDTSYGADTITVMLDLLYPDVTFEQIQIHQDNSTILDIIFIEYVQLRKEHRRNRCSHAGR